MNDVAVFKGPGDFFVAQFHQFQVVVLLFRRIFHVVHFRRNFNHFDVFQFGVEIFNFLASVINAVPFELGGFQCLTGGHRFVQVRGRRIDFFGENERGVDTGTGQFAGIVIGWDVQVMVLCHDLNAAFTALHINRTLDVRTAVVFQPQINWNCHGLLLHFLR
ncbi:conserved hypothetical protein [Yersinia pestis Pestoides F]|nr:conserved hypothetical protein [Yersinia pestis Pestoides F]CQH53730.1 Uncharacterised protein [Yersinia pseudotuberculosis]